MTPTPKSKFRFPWRCGHHFEPLVNGDQFFPAMLAAIEQAQHFVALEMYLARSGQIMTRFIDKITQAASRGVQCYLLLDDFGARKLTQTDLRRLEHPHIRVQFYNPLRYGELRRSLFRDHRKLLVVDGRVAFVGGTGLVDEFDPRVTKERAWHEIMVKIQGPCIQDWLTLFVETWPTPQPALQALLREDHTRPAAANQLGRVTISQMSNRQEIKRSLIKHIRSAEHWVWCSTAYFVPSWKIRRSLSRAAKRGVDVRLMLPGPHTDHPAVRHAGRRFYYSLLRHGVRIYEYQPSFTHAKVYLSDHWCAIGSSNVDRWNLMWNLEANQEIEDQQVMEKMKAIFLNDLQQCREIDLACWQQRPWYRRALEWFWGRVDVILHRLTLRWRQR